MNVYVIRLFRRYNRIRCECLLCDRDVPAKWDQVCQMSEAFASHHIYGIFCKQSFRRRSGDYVGTAKERFLHILSNNSTTRWVESVSVLLTFIFKFYLEKHLR